MPRRRSAANRLVQFQASMQILPPARALVIQLQTSVELRLLEEGRPAITHSA